MSVFTFKQLVELLAKVKTPEDLNQFCYNVDVSYQHGRITYKDNETFYAIINNLVKRDLIENM